MLKRKHLVLGFLTFCLTATLLIGATCSIEPYDPWKDTDDNGVINILDILGLAVMFGTEGTPINKTALLLELQSTVGYLNEALETRVPKIGYISVAAAAFEAKNSPYEWSVDKELDHHENFTVSFYASVQLPHGASVKNLTFYWWDLHEEPTGGPDLTCYLFRYNQTSSQFMAITWSIGDSGYGSSYDDTISYATVDNSQYAYSLQVDIPGEGDGHGLYYFQYAVIEYEHPI